jgi:hypothetical protein
MNAVTGPHKGVAKFLAKCVVEALNSRLNDGRVTGDFSEAAISIDNLVPGGLPIRVITQGGYQEGWDTMINEWLKVVISDHQS